MPFEYEKSYPTYRDVDIFIKTSPDEFDSLQICLQSISKFSVGFRKVVIVCDKTKEEVKKEWLQPDWVVHYVSPPQGDLCHVNVLKQMGKLLWFHYTNADAVLILNANQQFTTATAPENFMTKGKFHWFFRPWNRAGAAVCWKKSTESLLKFTSSYEATPVSGFICTLKASYDFKQYLCQVNSASTIYDAIMNYVEIHKVLISEFNLLGNFIWEFSEDYTKLVDVDYGQYHNVTIANTH